MRGGPHHDHADIVALGITQQGLRDVAGFEHMKGNRLAIQVKRSRPLPQHAKVAPVNGGFAGRRVVARCCRRIDHRDAGQPSAGAAAEDALDGGAQGVQGGVAGIPVRNGHQDDRRCLNLPRRQRARLVMHARGAQPAFEVRPKTGRPKALATLGDHNLFRIGQVKCQRSSRCMTFGGFGLEAAQDNLLQPLGQVCAPPSGWHRIGPQALAQPAPGLRVAKGQLARGQFVQHDADGKDVAARISAHADHLLGRHPGR